MKKVGRAAARSGSKLQNVNTVLVLRLPTCFTQALILMKIKLFEVKGKNWNSNGQWECGGKNPFSLAW